MQIHDVVEPNDVIFVMDSHIGQACYDQAKVDSELLCSTFCEASNSQMEHLNGLLKTITLHNMQKISADFSALNFLRIW